MNWRKATFEERGKRYVDHFTDDHQWKCAEGFDVAAAEDGFPVMLLEKQKGEWRYVRMFANARDAMKFAEKRARS